ncbi:hypothetical protein F5Y00DRAFT_256113 [Daldinia vernicosa]|uniref:uncharacterized protein n=1 Tax=Daldinia vernicosa TaxID=114800 RepID=UPI0020073A4B|nr:uncharacterized protein F5Y00DRAFT_256113 [Daldinia vernicosa]KAI0844300.1 hypothetical protein F5Y00DRAFT_256113 [Daldinia vernicosa]
MAPGWWRGLKTRYKKIKTQGGATLYETLLSRDLIEDLSSTDEAVQNNDIDQTDSERRRSQMHRLVQAGLEKTGKEATVKQNIQGAINYVSPVKELIDMAVKSVPEAAIAWTDACFALQILMIPINEAAINRDGIAYVVSRIEWYWNLSRLLEENQVGKSAGLRGELENRIIELYKRLLSYQMKSASLYYRNRLVVILRDIVKRDDWENTLESMKSLEIAIQRDIDTYTNFEIKDLLEKLVEDTESMLHDIYRAIRDQTMAQKKTQQEEKDNECLRALYVSDPSDDKRRIKETKGGSHQESSNWILEHEDFQTWRDNDESNVLWIKGDPGKGKTMLLITIVEELEKLAYQNSSPSTMLSYFFCQGINSNLNNATDVLRGLVYRFGVQQSCLIPYLRKKYETSDQNIFKGDNAFFVLSGVLEDMLRAINRSRVYITNFLNSLRETLRYLKPDIEQALGNLGTRLHLEHAQNAEQVSHAINAYIDFKISSMLSLQEDTRLKSRVRDILYQKAAELENVPRRRILAVLEGMSSGELCELMLSVAISAYRPLQLVEMAALLGLSQEIQNASGSAKEIVDECGSFLTVREDHIYLIHQSAKDYLNSQTKGLSLTSTLTNSHRTIFSQSLRLMSTLRKNIYDLPHPGLLIGEIETPNPDPLAFMRYSSVHWLNHFFDFYSTCQDQDSSCECDMVGKFLQEKFIYWLEALSLIKYMGDAILSMTRLEGLLKVYTSALIFSPVNYLARKTFLKEESEWIKIKPEVELSWSPCLKTLEGHKDRIYSVAFSHDSTLLATGSLDDKPIKIWDTKNWTLQYILASNRMAIFSLAFSHDSSLLALGLHDRIIEIWDIKTLSLQQTLEVREGNVLSVEFSYDSRLLASRSDDGAISIWNIEAGTFHQPFEEGGYKAQSITFSRDSTLLASGLHDHTIKIWDIKTWTVQQTFQVHGGDIFSVAFSHDSKHLASGLSDNIKIWNAATGSLEQTIESPAAVSSLTFSHDSKLLASGLSDGKIKIWDSMVTGSLQRLSNNEAYRLIQLSHDSELLALATQDDTIKIWDIATGSLRREIGGHSPKRADWIIFSHDSNLLAVPLRDGSIRIWDVASGSLQRKLHIGRGATILSFDDTSLSLDANIGIKIADGTTYPSQTRLLPRILDWYQYREAKCYGYGISYDKSWITWNERNVLWLPPEYRPTRSESRNFAISSLVLPSTGSTVVVIALICLSGKAITIGLAGSGPSPASESGAI